MLVNFDPKFQLEFAGVEITGDSGSLAYLETAEQWIKEDYYSFNQTRSSSHNFTDNQVLHQLFASVYNLDNFLRLMIIPIKLRDWSRRTLQVKLKKTYANVIRYSRHVLFHMKELRVSKWLFNEILERISYFQPVSIVSCQCQETLKNLNL